MSMRNEAGGMGRRRRAARGAVAALMGLAVALAGGEAEASGGVPGGELWVGGAGAVAGVLGVAAGVAVGLSDSDAGRPSTGVRAFGLATGTLNLATSVLVLAVAIDDANAGLYAIGGVNVAVGVTDIVLTLVRASRPAREPSPRALSWSVAPFGITDAAGRRTVGAGLRVVTF